MRWIRKELDQIYQDVATDEGKILAGTFQVKVVQSSKHTFSLKATVAGPEDSPYHEGNFIISIDIPHSYPFDGLIARFATPIWHSNIGYENGRIGLSILEGLEWHPEWTIDKLFLAMFSILPDPIATGIGVMNMAAAKEYLEDRHLFDAKARSLTTELAESEVAVEEGAGERLGRTENTELADLA